MYSKGVVEIFAPDNDFRNWRRLAIRRQAIKDRGIRRHQLKFSLIDG